MKLVLLNPRNAFFWFVSCSRRGTSGSYSWLLNSQKASCIDVFSDLLRHPSVFLNSVYAHTVPTLNFSHLMCYENVGHISKSRICQRENVTFVSPLALSVLTLDAIMYLTHFLAIFMIINCKVLFSLCLECETLNYLLMLKICIHWC